MKKILTIVFAFMAMISMTACGSKTAQQAETTGNDSTKVLVLYYSQTGATKTVAEALAGALNADIEAIEVVEPYAGTYDETIQRCMSEQQTGTVPEIKPVKANISDYDIVFLGYPIWFGTYARPIHGLIAANDFAGKKIVPFCTFGSGGLEASAADLKAALPKAEILEGYGVRNARVDAAAEEVDYFLKSEGYIDGEVQKPADFSQQQPVEQSDIAVFDNACGDYIFPLGTPVTVGKRETAAGTEYLFTADSKGPDGTAIQSKIYVVAPTDTTRRAYFTKVVR